MWPFKRKSEAPVARGPQPVPAPVIRRDWAALPAIQRTIGLHPLTAPSDRFSDDLATHHDPSVSSEQMGHQVSADAPAGMVLTVARSASTRSNGPAMIPRPPVQRRAQSAVAESGEWNGDEAAPAETRPDPVPTGVQRIAVVERPAVSPIAELPPLTSLPPDVEPVAVSAPGRRSDPVAYQAHQQGPVQRQVQFEESVAPAPRLTLGQARRLGLGPAISRVSDRSVQRSANASLSEVAEGGLASSATQQPPVGESSATPASPTQTSGNDASSATTSSPPTVQRAALSEASTAQSLASITPSVTEASDGPRLNLPLAPTATREARADQAVDSPVESSAEATLAPKGAVVPEATAASSAATSSSVNPPGAVGVQRSVGISAPSSPDFESRVGMPTGIAAASPTSERVALPLVVQRAPRTDAGATTPAAFNTTADAPLVGSRSIVTLPTATSAMPGGAEQLRETGDMSHSITNGNGDGAMSTSPNVGMSFDPVSPTWGSLPVAVQRAAAGGLATAAAVNDHPATSRVTAFAPTVLSRVASDVAAPPAPAVQRTSSWPSLPLAPTPVAIQRAAEEPEVDPQAVSSADDGESSVQRSWFDGDGSVTGGPHSTFTVSRVAVAAAPPAIGASSSTSETPAETDLDALAGRLYDRIRTRLKSELLIDRERAGFLTDLR